MLHQTETKQTLLLPTTSVHHLSLHWLACPAVFFLDKGTKFRPLPSTDGTPSRNGNIKGSHKACKRKENK
jgi:hypothetical protein